MNEVLTQEKHAVLSMPDIIAMVARLAQVLAEEADLLEEMKIPELEKLQPEKIRLTTALDRQRQLLHKNPDLLSAVSAEERAEFKGVSEIFEVIMKENHRRLLMAREINLKVVQAITEVVAENNGNKIYNAGGGSELPRPASISVTLNKTV